MAAPSAVELRSLARIGRLRPVLIKLGLNDGPPPAKPRLETESPPSPEEPVSSLEEPLSSLEEPVSPLEEPVSSLDEAIRQLELSELELAESTLVPEAAAVQHAVPEDVAEAVVYWLALYSRGPSEAARKINELAAKAPERVVETLLPLYQTGNRGGTARFLASLLSNEDRTVAKLCDPAASLDGSVCAAKALTQHEPNFYTRFAKGLLIDDRMTEAARQRGLTILKNLGSGAQLIPTMMQFLQDPDGRIRSKAALMFGKIISGRGIMERLVRDEDARVRANLVEGLWNCPASVDCRPLFRHALEDPNHRVVANALVGLHRLGENREVVAHLIKMARHPEALFRAAVAWVMGQTGDKRYTGVLRQLVRDPDPLVRRNALRSLGRINLACAGNTASENHPNSGTQGDSSDPVATIQ